MTKTHTKIILIVIRTEMCRTKNLTEYGKSFIKKIPLQNPYKNNMDIHLYRDMHEGKLIRIWIGIRTHLCMTKTHTRQILIVIRT